MIFERITIKNLFSYFSEQTFDDLSPTSGRPIVLIAGRNGFGKTSFINSVKLLFLGTGEEMLRFAQVGRTLRPHTYLLGIDHVWQGVFNREARDAKEEEYGITLVWREEKGRVTARRFWQYYGDEPIANLRIETDFDEEGLGSNGVIHDPEEAEEFLQRRLPRDIVPFFFYDGEIIQALAEANEQGRMKQIEKLLGLAAVDTLDDYLRSSISEWKRDGTKEKEQAELDSLQAQFGLKAAEKSRLQAEEDDANAELENIARDIRKHERYIQATRKLVEQQNAPHTKEKFERLTSEYEAICQRIGETLPPLAPLWAAPLLVEAIEKKLDGAAGSSSKKFAEEMQNIFELLPQRLFDEPTHPTPTLSASQKVHYKVKMKAILKQFTEPPSGGYFSASPSDASVMSKRFSYFSQATTERQRLADDLREASKLRREWFQTKSEIESVDELSPEQKKIFKERQLEVEKLQDKRDRLLSKRGSIHEKISNTDNDLVRLKSEIHQQETKRVKAGINSQLIERAEQARSVFEIYSHRLKEQRRQEIEEALNKNFKQLMTSHKLITRIELNDAFAIRYIDENNNDIGLSNISSGMKQLTAQALLWAFSEVSGQNVPVIVDTPLARIDRQHQEMLLRNYYPNAAKQVIVLPTDAELDREKYRLLKPMICAEFRLENSTGDRTTVKANTAMYNIGAP